MAAKLMSPDKLKKFEELIQQELKESIAYIEEVSKGQSLGAKESSGDLSSYAFHQADQGSDTHLMEQSVMLMEHEREKISLLKESLQKIYNGTYGICEMCGKNISESRLEIIPYAHYCVSCTEKMEDKKRKQRK